jgi:hypothetical protein
MEDQTPLWEQLRSLSAESSEPMDPKSILAEVMGWEVNFQPIKITMNDGSTIAGKVNIRGFKGLSEFLNLLTDEFVAVVPDGPESSRSVVMLNKNHILYVETSE